MSLIHRSGHDIDIYKAMVFQLAESAVFRECPTPLSDSTPLLDAADSAFFMVLQDMNYTRGAGYGVNSAVSAPSLATS